MNPLDLMIWSLAVLFAIACFFLVVILLKALVRTIFQRATRKASETVLIPGHGTIFRAPAKTSSDLTEKPDRRGEQR